MAAAAVARELGVEHVARARADARRPRTAGPRGRGAAGRACSAACCRSEPGDPPGPSAARPRTSGAASSRQVPIETRGRRSGWIEAHSRAPREFTRRGGRATSRRSPGCSAPPASARGTTTLVSDSEARFRELANTTPALMWMTDAEGDVTFVNEGWLRFTGGTLGRGRDVRARAPTRTIARRRCGRWEEASARREEFRCEYRLRHAPSGGYRWVLEVGAPRFAGGEFVGYVGTATDIHERRTMEEALRESEASFRDLADTAPAMMWTTDEDGLVTFVNEGWLRFTGTHLEDELGASWQLGVHPDDAEAMLSTLGSGARRAPLLGARVPPAPPLGRVPLDRGPRRAALRGRALLGLRGHGDRHPRAQDDGGAAARGLPARAQDRRDAPAQPAARAAAPDRGRAAGRPLPARRPRRRDRRRLVRRARAPRRPRGARGGRRGRPRPARRRHDGPAPQRLPRLRPGRVLAGRGGGAHQPARDERGGGRDGHGASTWCSTARPARCRSARAGHPPPLVLTPGRAALPRGRALGADRRVRPGRVPRGERRAPARLLAAALHGRPRGAPRRAALEERLGQLAEVAGAAGRRPRRALRARDRRSCSATATRATTWRCSPCGRCRRRPSGSA